MYRHLIRTKSIIRSRPRLIISIAVLVLVIIVLAPQYETLLRSFKIVGQAAILPTSVAALCTILTYLLSAWVYLLLAKYPIPWQRMLAVQTATALTARIAPIGIGTMGLNALYLRKVQHTTSEALAVVTTNNALGFIGHLLLLGIVSLAAPWPEETSANIDTQLLIVLGITALIATILLWSGRLRERTAKALKSFGKSLAAYRKVPGTLALALVSTMILSAVYVLALQYSAEALTITLPFAEIFIIYTISILAGVITPTPGGLVGVEAGLVAGFVAYGVAAEQALAIALLYRLITYWIPLAPGYIAFRHVTRRYW